MDTTDLHPAVVPCAVDLFGADHVLMGTDWPVVVETPDRVRASLVGAGFDAAEHQMIADDNALRPLGVDGSKLARSRDVG